MPESKRCCTGIPECSQARLCHAAQCIRRMHLGSYSYSHGTVSGTSILEAAEKDLHLLQSGQGRLTVLTGGHEHKYDACRAEIGCVSDYT